MTRGHWTTAVLWAVLIEALVLWPSPPSVSTALWGLGGDKLVHATLFAVQAFWIARALAAQGRPLWPAWVGATLYGAVTEWQQHFIPSRSMELGDFLADTVGAVLGLVVFAALAPRRRELHR
ncbi:MAG: VanZ family protein [Gemmatimonadetes bacterium]|nr:VanZ family protein [Gemmatimonadota bacterium]